MSDAKVELFGRRPNTTENCSIFVKQVASTMLLEVVAFWGFYVDSTVLEQALDSLLSHGRWQI